MDLLNSDRFFGMVGIDGIGVEHHLRSKDIPCTVFVERVGVSDTCAAIAIREGVKVLPHAAAG